tara:strand:+ start:17514 stop:18191 length:678 start_codon:yes stop_codon:yes gene_type:complete
MPSYDYIYNLIATNLDLLRFFYSIVIAFVCLIIVIKTDKIFRLSNHQGIRYFRNAFFFYGIAFILRYVLAGPNYFALAQPFFEFFLVMGGFFLLYSLLWKKFKASKSQSSLLNPILGIFYIIALVIVFLDYFWTVYYFLFFSQIIIFAIASIISCKNYKEKGKEHKFLKLYFIAMILSFLAWSFNFIFASFFKWRLRFLANVYILNVIVFLIILYGVIKLTKKRD